MSSSYQTEIPNRIGNYSITETLGSGAFGKVKLEKVAIKIISKASLQSSSHKNRIEKEITFLRTIKHLNIVTLFEIIEDNSFYFLICEYIKGGELFSLIAKKSRLNSNETCLYLYQLINAVEYLYASGISHRDLKMENILLSAGSSRLKVIDFGLATETKGNRELSTQCGSPNYSSPEMLKGCKYDGHLVDIWSIGIIAFVMICGFLPFDDPNEKELIKKITKGRYDFPHFTPFIFRDFIRKTLVVNPRNRMTLIQMKEHTIYHHGKALFFRENVIYQEDSTLNPLIHAENKKRTFTYLIKHNLAREFNQSESNEWEQDASYKIVYEKLLASSNWKKFLLEISDNSSSSFHGAERKENEPCSPQDIIRRLRLLNINERFKLSMRKPNGRNERSASMSRQQIITDPNSEMNSICHTIQDTSYDYDKMRSLKTPNPVHRTINLNLVNNISSSKAHNELISLNESSTSQLRVNKQKLSHKSTVRSLFSPSRDKEINHKYHMTECAPWKKCTKQVSSRIVPQASIYMTVSPSKTKGDLSPSVKTSSMNKLKGLVSSATPTASIISISFRERTRTPLKAANGYQHKAITSPKATETNYKANQLSIEKNKGKEKMIHPLAKSSLTKIAVDKQLHLEGTSRRSKKTNHCSIRKILLTNSSRQRSEGHHCLTKNTKGSLLNNYFVLLNN